MKRLPKVLAALSCALIVAALVSACSEKAAEPLFSGEYHNWERTVEKPLTYPIPGHGARRRGIFINEIGTQVKVTTDESRKKMYEYPPGTIILKENFNDLEGTALANLTIMIKAPGDDQAMRSWIWIAKNPGTGEEKVFTESKFCLTCHDGANEEHPYGDGNRNEEFRDYVFFPYAARSE